MCARANIALIRTVKLVKVPLKKASVIIFLKKPAKTNSLSFRFGCLTSGDEKTLVKCASHECVLCRPHFLAP